MSKEHHTKPRRIPFTFDARDFVSLDALEARGIAMRAIVLRHPVTGEERTMYIPATLPLVHRCAGQCWCERGANHV